LKSERIGSWIGLAAAAVGTAYIFSRGASVRGCTGSFWTALVIVGPLFVSGGWLLGRFLGAYIEEFWGLPRREKIGFALGALGGAFMGSLLAVFSSHPGAQPVLVCIGLFVGPGIGRDIAKR
jgi:hypothetical protein